MTDLEQAICNFRAAAARYDKPDRYYRGDHDLAFATEKFENAFGSLFREFALNLCPSICDAVRDKLKIDGFTIGRAGSARRTGPAKDTVGRGSLGDLAGRLPAVRQERGLAADRTDSADKEKAEMKRRSLRDLAGRLPAVRRQEV